MQETRKNAGFDVSDRIRLQLRFDDAEDAAAVRAAFEIAGVAAETLAVEAAVLDGGAEFATAEFVADIGENIYANRGAFAVAVSRIGDASCVALSERSETK